MRCTYRFAYIGLCQVFWQFSILLGFFLCRWSSVARQKLKYFFQEISSGAEDTDAPPSEWSLPICTNGHAPPSSRQMIRNSISDLQSCGEMCWPANWYRWSETQCQYPIPEVLIFSCGHSYRYLEMLLKNLTTIIKAALQCGLLIDKWTLICHSVFSSWSTEAAVYSRGKQCICYEIYISSINPLCSDIPAALWIADFPKGAGTPHSVSLFPIVHGGWVYKRLEWASCSNWRVDSCFPILRSMHSSSSTPIAKVVQLFTCFFLLCPPTHSHNIEKTRINLQHSHLFVLHAGTNKAKGISL